MTRALLAVVTALALQVCAAPAHAQFIPEGGPGREQQEFTSTLLLGPEATVLGAFLGGGAVFLVERQCCTKRHMDPAIAGVAIGAGVGAAIGATWAQWTISNHFHPGSRMNSAIGGMVGAAGGAAAYFGGPDVQPGNERIFRVLALLLGPSIGAYAGWHVGREEMGTFESLAPRPAWADHVGFDVPSIEPAMVQSVSFRF